MADQVRRVAAYCGSPDRRYTRCATPNYGKPWRQLTYREVIMNKKHLIVLIAVGAIALIGMGASGVRAQNAEVKEKPRLYTYFATWQIPRARWAEMDKANAADKKLLDQAIGSGTLVSYGDDTNLVHQPEGPTHDNWWQAMSMAGILDVLESMSNSAPAPILASATKHADAIYVSRFYSWHAGTYKGAYTHTAYYKLKADAPEDAVDSISKNFIVPLMEKLLADGAIAGYEVDEEAIHTESPDGFWVEYISPTSAGLDKANAAIGGAMKANPMIGPAIGSMVDFTVHRDYLSHTNAVYK